MDEFSGSIAHHQMELPPGFRFHPTDEELITHYLSAKVVDSSFVAEAIGQVDLNKVEPWDLPWKAKMGEKEWYFFCLRDRKYPTGPRTNRATDAGYWKATGKDKQIFRAKILIGMKKTLVFYGGRAPRGEKTDWIMHEYRLEGKNSLCSPQKEWVVCRIFKKSSGGKKVHISGLVKMMNHGPDSDSLPPMICEELSSSPLQNSPDSIQHQPILNIPKAMSEFSHDSSRLEDEFKAFEDQDLDCSWDFRNFLEE